MACLSQNYNNPSIWKTRPLGRCFSSEKHLPSGLVFQIDGLECNLKLPWAWGGIIKLAKRVGCPHRQCMGISRGQRTETRTALINRLVLAAHQFWARQQHSSSVSRPLRSRIVFDQENDAWHEGKARCKWWSNPQVVE